MERIAVTAILAAILAGCGSGDDDGMVEEVNCADEPRADTYVANLSKEGEAGRLEMVLVSSDPAPPAKGDNSWLVEVNDASGQPVDDATITLTPFMPDHAHGTLIDVVVTPAADGMYDAAPVNLWMPGLWQVTVDAEADGVEDSAVFSFCIEG